MGMFTTVIHPETGKRIQFKCGHDQCDTYKLGDTVDWFYSKYEPGEGCCLDGVYSGFGDFDYQYWIVIKDHKIHSVEPVEWCTEEEGGGLKDIVCQEAALAVKYGIQAPPFEAWPAKLWLRKAKSDYEWKQEEQKDAADTYGMSIEEKTVDAISKWTRRKMREPSLMRQVMGIRTIADNGIEGEEPVKIPE
jgi:hypothetical protein